MAAARGPPQRIEREQGLDHVEGDDWRALSVATPADATRGMVSGHTAGMPRSCLRLSATYLGGSGGCVDRRRGCRRRGRGARGRLRRGRHRCLGDRSGPRPQDPCARAADRRDRRAVGGGLRRYRCWVSGAPAQGRCGKIRVLERGSGHGAGRPPHTGAWRVGGHTVETDCFTRPERVDFRLVRGPVPHVVERFTLTATNTDHPGLRR